ncbi:hypothetical protein BBO99_00003637 [Phytophthora kernoviae]|uniref:Bromo domain-containing protein n=1 Tax=Phytophthora kernoviae TaxID=325452 RepID=A0A3R7K0N3_9STRA|nr:hypothetical protein JM18_005116 [Phytophthora kernoviae]RLN44613.1 hypothetical protein BBI17_003694 [Phytophthora kernoviae]RLN81517.1 hypothetical protein BBO99_00003637 [Phytophthora kernoviae]
MISEAAHAECVRLLELLTNPRVQESWSWVFMTPVNIPGYEKFVKKPMDLGTIKKNLGSKPSRCRFKSHEKFARDVRLVFNNALVYNKDDQDVKGSVYAAAQHLLRVFETAYAKAIESVFKADDAAVAAAKAAHREAKEEKRKAEAAPFLQPVDLSHFPDYRVKVPHRMHLYGVQKKLRSGSYATMDAFAYDMRLIFSNCLVYNSDVILSKVMRNHAVILMKLFESHFAKIGGTWPGIPERWKCHQIIHDILAHRTDGQETAQWFKFPVESYYDSPDQIPYGYYDTVKEPMDIGTVSSRLHLGEYKRTSEFIAGMKLVFDNCIRYWKLDPQGQTYCDSAETLQRVLHTQSAAILSTSGGSSTISKEKQRVPSSSSKPKSGSSSTQPSVAPVTSTSVTEREKVKKKSSKSSKLSKSSKSARESGGALPEKEICLGIMKLLRAHKMKGFRGIEIKTAGPFLTAVDTTKYPDYLKIVSEPMDFAKIERKLKSDRYGSVDEFSADVHLIFSNCHKYNSDPVEGADIRAMATNLRNYFAELCNEKLGPLDASVVSSSGVNKDISPTIATNEVMLSPEELKRLKKEKREKKKKDKKEKKKKKDKKREKKDKKERSKSSSSGTQVRNEQTVHCRQDFVLVFA